MGGPVGAEVRTSDGLIPNFRTFHGFSVDATVAGVVEFRDGSATGKVLAVVRIGGASGGYDVRFFERGIATAGGIWVQIVSGTHTVTVYGV